ncbi:preprotein translocase subunit SecA [Hathewaya proteolytica DSM 3090]|uniref:Protein translocase subunit SecA n=1 Tax=Hathewaya proteolytica DSM 3090 TaxID=1121331 RepID=A0A1M6PKY3_9CLOT|nr:preprotein translocase subunit SecA [Hathewaya proteolytica]SHK08619.1 preprotein translocase subunit SecA [Hathewaya proteolytica DSM 3090]
MKGMIGIFENNYSRRELKKIEPIVDKIESLEGKYCELSDEELRGKTQEFRDRLKSGEKMDSLLPDIFATVREAAFRVLNKKHYRVQLIGGVVLSQGRIAEMKTGEGKTLVATLPAYLNAIEGRCVHIITTNDYLAKRDRDEMGRVHEFLGLTVGVILNEMSPDVRREQYKCDIVYGTNSEFGFDYLRDNMAKTKSERVQRELGFCIVDEVDSILIDEARTPLIISGEGKKPSKYYITVNEFAKKLKKNVEFEIDRDGKGIALTDSGIKKLEKYFGVENYADYENRDLQHHVTQALRAHFTMHLNKDYIVRKGEIMIVDEFTGRVMEGRRFSEGLHEAIEAKEGVKINKESKTLATITIQNYFRMYQRLSGMSGTAATEENEFQEIYGLDVICIPTNKPVSRVDHKDRVFKYLSDKYDAIIEDIITHHENGQPILVGTSSIQKSEDISYLLKRRGIKHYLLNAKNPEKEAKIVENAGKAGAITIATNMAGRGTDIKLDDESRAAGGLRIIGTDRHEARRIDNQLKGRSGRQGDVGSSQFYVSLQDDLFRVYDSEVFNAVFGKLNIPEHDEIHHKAVFNAIETAQKNIEGNNFETRKNIIGYDDVVNKQRLVIYEQRNMVLDNDNVHDSIISIIKNVINDLYNRCNNGEESSKVIKKYVQLLSKYNITSEKITEEKLMAMKKEDIVPYVQEVTLNKYNNIVENYALYEKEKSILLKNVDEKWIEYLDSMEFLKEGIRLKSYRQQDPVREFQIESSAEFNEMISCIQRETVKELLV